jgi:hypothetical protein
MLDTSSGIRQQYLLAMLDEFIPNGWVYASDPNGMDDYIQSPDENLEIGVRRVMLNGQRVRVHHIEVIVDTEDENFPYQMAIPLDHRNLYDLEYSSDGWVFR